MSQKLIDATQKKVNRPFCVPPLLDYDVNVKEMDKQTLMKRSRQLYSNSPLVRSVIQQRSMFCSKGGWTYKSLVEDKEWRQLAEEFFAKWKRVCCVDGTNWETLIYQICIQMDVMGDAFIILTTSQDGLYPQLQTVPSHRVGCRYNEEIVPDGKYKGKKIISGIVVNSYNRAIAYKVLGDTPEQDRYIDAIDMVHIYDQESFENRRGIPLISHAVQAIDDLENSKNAELVAQNSYAAIHLIETLGEEDDNTTFLNNACGNNINQQPVDMFDEYREGTIKVYRSQSSSLKALEAQRPAPAWQQFRDKLIQEIVVSMNWSTNLLDGSDKSSVEARLNIRVAELTVSDRVSMLSQHISRIMFFTLSMAINNGLLPPTPNYYRMSFSRPSFISAEMSKMENSTRENLLVGITNLSQIVEADGRDLETHLREQYTEKALDILIRAEIESKFGVDLSQASSPPSRPQQDQANL